MRRGTMGDDAPQREAAVEIDAVCYTYPGAESAAVDGVSLTVERGQRLGILGPNGGGKSTLIKLILGLLEPTHGHLRVLGARPEAARLAGRIGYLPQRVEADLDWPLSVRQVVGLGITCRRAPWRGLSADERAGVEESLELVGMAAQASRPIGSLSGGQLQRVMIARAVAPRPELLVLDEPTLGVDVGGQRMFAEMIETLRARLGLTVVLVTHELRAVAGIADRVACLSRTLHFHDAPEGLTPAVLAQVFAHDVAGVFGEVHVEAHTAEECDDPAHTREDHHDHGGGG
mgnify:CR=1 FL=1